MKTTQGLVLAVAATVTVWAMAGRAEERDSGRMFNVVNHLIVEYDDNVYETKDNAEESFKIIEALQLSLDVKQNTRYLSLRYRPQYTWWDNKEPDNTDWSHDVDLVWNEVVSRKLSLGFVDSFTYVDRPELLGPDGSLVRGDQTYMYNTGTLTARLTPRETVNADGSVRYAILRYDDDRMGERENYDLWVFGLTGRGLVRKDITGFVDLRYETLTYPDAGLDQEAFMVFPGATNQNDVTTRVPDRGSDTWQLGLGAKKTFSPTLVGTLRGGYMYRDYAAANISSESSPYVDVQMTKFVSDRTQLAVGAGYSLFRSDVLTYAGQTRSTASASASHRLGSFRVTGGLTYVHSNYEADQSVVELDEDRVSSGSEDALSATATAAYDIDNQNAIEAGYTFVDLSSDIRDDFQRNRINLGWRFRP